MNTSIRITAAALLFSAAAGAFAQEAATVAAAPAGTAVSRQAVVAELARARAAGELDAGTDYGFPSHAAPAGPATTARSVVVADLVRARRAGETDSGTGYGYIPYTQAGQASRASERTRAEVKADVLAAVRRGERFSVGERG